MAKPIINITSAVSCEDDFAVKFTWNGSLIKSNYIRICSAITDNVIYEHTVSSGKYEHIVPANTIDVDLYGTQYYAQVKVVDLNGVESSLSDKCYLTVIHAPKFKFSNITDGQKIINSACYMECSYSQQDGELLREYQFILYDENKEQINSTEIMYDTTNMFYTFKGLDNGSYYIRAIGQTVNNYTVDTGYYNIQISYERTSAYSTFYLENNPEKGYISFHTNLILIKYEGGETFEIENSMVNTNGKELYYDSGFEIRDDFTIMLRGKDLWKTNKCLFRAKNEVQEITLSSMIYDDNTLRFKLTVPTELSGYVLYSNPIIFTSDDMVTIWLRRKDNICKIKAYVE